MILVRGGEDRDLRAIADMGHARAGSFRFHLERSTELVKHAITRNACSPVWPPQVPGSGVRHCRGRHYRRRIVVLTVVGRTWTIEECGDRDASGARVGALLQALIARDPVATRPVIRGWLPAGFLPPQVTIASSSPAPPLLLARPLSARVTPKDLTTGDV